MTRYRCYLGLSLVIALGAGAFWATGGDGGAAPARGQSSSGITVAPSPRESASGAKPAADTVIARTYQLSFSQELSGEQGALTPLRLRATLAITPRDAAGRDLVKLSSVSVEGDAAPLPKELAVVLARQHDAAGRLQAIELPADTSPTARSYLKAIAAALQYSPAPAAQDREWQATESDVGGSFASSYRRTDGEHVERFARRFLGNPQRPGPQMNMRLDGTTRFAFAPDGQLRSLETTERAKLGADEAWTLRSQLSVSLTYSGDAPAPWQLHVVGLARESLVAAPAPNGSAQEDDRRVAGRTLRDLRDEVRAAEELGDSMERVRERSRLLGDHAALIRLDSRAARAIAAELKQGAAADSEASLLAGSLSAAGTLEASHALCEVLSDAQRPEDRVQAAVSLNVSAAHDEATLAKLEAAGKDADPEVAGASMLALGNASRTVRARGGDAAGASQALADAYHAATSVEQRVQVVRAIGNSGDTSLLPLLEHALQSSSSDLQEAATYALRFMDASADALLITSLGSVFPEVREAALKAIELRPRAALLGALEAALAVERDPNLRRLLQRLLAQGTKGTTPPGSAGL